MLSKVVNLNNLSIRNKLIILFIIISIIPFIALGLVIGVTVEKILGEQATKNTYQLIDQVNATFESYITNLQNVSYLISLDTEVNSFFNGMNKEEQRIREDYSIRQKMQGFTSLYPEIAGIFLINKQGEYISNELFAQSDADLTKEEWYEKAVENKGIFKIIGKPKNRNIISQINYKDNEVVTVVRAILDRETQEVTGVILIDLKIRVLGEAMNNIRLGLSGYLMLVDEEGQELYSTNNKRSIPIPQEVLKGEEYGAYQKEIGKEKMEFIYQRTPFTQWTTVGVFYVEESVAEVREIKFYLMSFVFFLCLVGVTASYYFSHSISNPITGLMSLMKRVENGNMKIQYKEQRKDEIGKLGQTFNHMISKINSLISLNELQEKQKREAELRSLQAHIKPHFLYNTLDTINWMARKHGAKDVAEVVSSLSSLFRIGLSKGKDIILVKEEIKHIESYLRIQKARYQEKLNYEIVVDPSIEEVKILKLVLQPIVENAIYHGIKERKGAGYIKIDIKEQDDSLYLMVSDDGKGISKENVYLLKEKLHTLTILDKKEKESIDFGYGMMNVQARIKLTYGKGYGITLESNADKGTVVTIKLPVNR
ncbi:sensor histidine kinase [Bacillus sp. B1-b2]|uniref:sensor histidine kinase n=1 Tax=Bacillus sp. B1-b2 TaxID=2653201 RepID=UPI001261FBAC|nr:sensor histidine kinase [Bacillus sp. B1-b2]KAB7667617.1 sensor histidine kinase [Bacillus sp. B1-b2]